MRIGILNIGDELLAGKILNTNQFELARLLSPLGHDIPYGLVVGDDEDALGRALHLALAGDAGEGPHPDASSGNLSWPGVDALVLTGGLGPTRDDLTRQACAAFLGVETAEHPEALAWLGAFLGKPVEDLPWGQRVQARVPSGTQPLRNPAGTACGFRFVRGSVQVFAFPGVPKELEAMARMHLLPALVSDRVLLEKGLWTWGWSESDQRQCLEGLRLPDSFRFSSLPGERGVRISLQCLCPPAERGKREGELAGYWRDLLAAIPPAVVVDPEGSALPEAVYNELLARGATVSAAESCTGGGLGFLLTETPGSSAVFTQGFMTYSNAAKIELLGVEPLVLERHGAVSEETALAMARNCLERAGTTYAVAITGVAGPGGGTPEKPVGTVWIAVASRQSSHARKYLFRGDRQAVRWRSCYSALNHLRLFITGQLT